jgi:hypothetical protein
MFSSESERHWSGKRMRESEGEREGEGERRGGREREGVERLRLRCDGKRPYL